MDTQDVDLILLLASSSASLATTPKKDNWVDNAGELPPYVRKLARGIMKSGKSLSQAIAIAISRIKKWAAGGDDVDADTRAKSAKAVAQWEALKAKNAAKKLVKATREDGSSYLLLTNIGSYNTEMVRSAWSARDRARRQAMERGAPETPAVSMGYISELWTDFIVVEIEGSEGYVYFKIPYSVSGTTVDFGDPTPVKRVWEEVEIEDDDLTPQEILLLRDVLEISLSSPLDKVRTAVAVRS